MRYYDEVLAQAARNYAFTGDKKWEIRYRAVEPLPDKLLKDAIAVADDEIKSFFITMDSANTALIKMEYQSIDLVNEASPDLALQLLDSNEYAKQRKILSEGLEGFVAKIQEESGRTGPSDVMFPSVQKIVELERKLAISEEQIKKEKLLAIGELSARLAHDIRNPLSVIKNSIDLLSAKKDIDPKTLETYARIKRSVDRISYQIENVLNFVKPRKITLEKTSICSILDSVLNRMKIPQTIKIRMPQNDIQFTADITNMEIVFVNLLTNAIQAMNNVGEITIQAEIKNDKIVINVHDTGPGIPQQLLPKIFDPLFTTKQQGTGLGLVSCKNIIEQHNGMINVMSKPSGGTAFVITLPQQKE